MSIKISLKKIISDKDVKNYALFCDDNFKINGLNNLPIKKQTLEINKTIKFQKSDKKEFLLFNINSSQKIILCRFFDSEGYGNRIVPLLTFLCKNRFLHIFPIFSVLGKEVFNFPRKLTILLFELKNRF